MGPALGIAASLLTDVGFKALKQLTSGKKSQESSQAGITDPSVVTGQSVPGKSQSASAKSSRPDFNQIFDKIDTDGDGSISKTEFLAFKQKIDDTVSSLLKTQEEAGSSTDKVGGKAGASAENVFSALDTNKDGTVSKEELAAAVQHGHGHHHANSQGEGKENGGGSPAAFLSALLNIQAQATAA